MPIILAIEPDRRQAARLTGIVRQRVGAELILADTTEGALDAIGNRIPDMVLVPAFLSPQDDAALAAALRVIAAAAHVRTLTIPVLSSGERRAAPGGLLARWRRGPAESPVPDGCDPAVFAEQITAYLNEAAAERAELAVDDQSAAAVVPMVEAPPVDTPAVEAIEPFALLLATASVEIAPITEALAVDAPVVETVEPIAPLLATASVEIARITEALPVDTPALEAVEPVVLPLAATQAPADEDEGAVEDAVHVDEGAIDLLAQLACLSDEEDVSAEAASDERFAGERAGVYTIGTAAGEPAPDAEGIAIEGVAAEDADRPRADFVPWVGMYLTPGRMWPTIEGVEAEAPSPVEECPPEPEAVPIAARPRHLEWTELVASLRQDIERRRAEQVPASAPPAAAQAATTAPVRGSRPDTKQKRRGKNVQPTQDEWGFFDPEQCGFAALLAKLEEITVSPAPPDDDARRPA